MLEDIIVNGFSEDHYLRKSLPAPDLKKKKVHRRSLSPPCSDKILDGYNEAKTQFQKISKTPLTAGNYVMQIPLTLNTSEEH